ncbi:MAG TPA: GntR family transcriptional regulator, partial [Vicinamibacterales bacterium]|nr:GntR family transcriptional regulator [Vicinamibacterales bacterium]
MVEPVDGPSLPSASRRVKSADGIEPIRKTRIPEEIADRIRRLILDGTFPPGRPLPSERVLAGRFGVSRGSVRDGFRILEVIGLIEMRHGQGTFARELSVDRLVTPLASVLTYQRDLQDELLDVRRMFEPAVARVAAT